VYGNECPNFWTSDDEKGAKVPEILFWVENDACTVEQFYFVH